MLIPIATWPKETYLAKNVRHWDEASGVPTVYRLVDSPDLRLIVEHINIGPAPQLLSRIRHGTAIGFALGYDGITHDIPPFLLVLERDVVGDDKWYVDKFLCSGYPWLKLVQRRKNLGDDAMLPMMERTRRRLVWLIYDVLGMDLANVTDPVMDALMIPDVHAENEWEQFLHSPISVQLTDFVQAHDEQNREFHAAQRELHDLMCLKGQTPADGQRQISAEIDQVDVRRCRIVSRRHDLRVRLMEASGRACELFLRMHLKTRNDTIGDPYRIDVFSGHRHPDLSIRLAPNLVDGLMVWTLWSVPEREWPHRSPVASSREGPLQLMHQAGLDVVGNDEWFAWLDQNTDPGELTFSGMETYAMLDVQPLLWDSERFTKLVSAMNFKER